MFVRQLIAVSSFFLHPEVLLWDELGEANEVERIFYA